MRIVPADAPSSTRSLAPWIVVAEDNAPDVFLLKEALNQEGLSCRLDSIEDGEAALDFIAGLECDPPPPCPDLFIIDLNLPKKSGQEILDRLRTSSRCSAIPTIVMSSSDAPRDQQLGRDSGVQLYFRKPVELHDFMRIGGVVRDILCKPAGDQENSTA